MAKGFSRCPASPEAGLQYQFINHSAATPPWTTIFIGDEPKNPFPKQDCFGALS